MTPAHDEDGTERVTGAAAQARGDVVDSHMHLWDTTRFSYPWFAGVTRLDRPYLPEHYRAQVPEPGDLVFVEAACRPEQALAEVAFIEEQTRDSGFPITAVVAAVPVEDTAAREEHFALLSQRMLGSDWPMSTSEAGPRGILAWQTIVLDSTGLSLEERAAVAADTARAVYRLPPHAPH